MTISATLTYPGTGEDSIRVDAPFDTQASAEQAIEALLVGGLNSHVKDVRLNAKTGKVDVYAAGCSCFGHIIDDMEGKRPKPSLAMSFTTKAKDAVASIRRLLAEGASELVVEVVDTEAVAAAAEEAAEAAAAAKAAADEAAKLTPPGLKPLG